MQNNVRQKLNLQPFIVYETESQNIPKGYLIFKPGCQIQEFDPYDAAVVKFLDPKYSLTCARGTPLAVVTQPYIISINFNSLNHYGGFLNYCLYMPIFRVENGTTDNGYRYGPAERFFNSIKSKHEFVKIECYNLYKKIYEDFFLFVLKKPHVERRCQRNIEEKDKKGIQKAERLSIAIVGIDSVSRLNFIRFCPKTREYLLNKMKAIELKGYNKIGDNTFHNLVPMLLGKFVSELKWEISEPFDKYPFVWKDYANEGYRTVFAEDEPDMSLFNYLKNGFYGTPTDYYLRPFYIAFNQSTLNILNKYQCLGHRLHTAILLQYNKEVFQIFKNDLYFSFLFITSLSHSYLSGVRHGDDIYKAFLKNITDGNLLNNTVLFFLSDHGIRFGKLRASYVGRLEERLPMAFIVFPSWFKKKYPDIIKTVKMNSFKLTTPFDIYATLKDLLHFTGHQRKSFNSTARGISLFDDIPDGRTCEDASILPHWCTCRIKTKLDVNDPLAKKVSNFVIDHINNLTKGVRNICSQLYLHSIMQAWVSSANDKIRKYIFLWGNGNNERVNFGRDKVGAVKDITLMLIADPSKAQFEATVRYDERSKKLYLSDDVSRINKYGNQSACVYNYNLRKYCYCLS